MSFKLGEVRQLGDHYLLCGDSTDEYTVKMFVKDWKVKSVVCDPPYGVHYTESKEFLQTGTIKHRPIINDWITSESEYYKFSYSWLSSIAPHLAKKNSMYIFSSDIMLFPVREAMTHAGVSFGQLLVWVKNHSVLGRLDYLPQHEMILYGWYGTHEFMKSKDKSVLLCPKPNKSKLHPTMKPVPLLRRLILNSTQVGNYVFDGFGGSGSTLIACEQTKRKCLMIELDPEYCQVICDRFEKVTTIKPKEVETLSL